MPKISGPSIKPSAASCLSPVVTAMFTLPIPKIKSDVTVTLVSGANEAIVPSVSFPAKISPPSSDMLHGTLVATAVPVFEMVAVMPSPPEMASMLIIGAGMISKYKLLLAFLLSDHTI